MRNRLQALYILCAVMVAGVLGRSLYIQLVHDPRLTALAKRQFTTKMLVKPRRGSILDRLGEPMAINAEVHSLAANPRKIDHPRTIARSLSRAFGLPYEKTLERLRSQRGFVWLKRHLSDVDVDRFEKYGLTDSKGELLAGLWMVKENQRRYPHGELAGQVLGSVNLDSEGVDGIELQANSRLEGKIASVAAIRDALGRPTFIDAVAAQGAKDGETLKLTIDASLQFSVEEALQESMQKTKARAGSVIVMDAVTGDLLAIAHAPGFNPNSRSASLDVRRNRVVTDGYEPGSTLKPILLSAALMKGMKLSDRLNGENGSFVVQGKRISEAESHEKFEWIDLKKMIQVSSNVASAKLALKIGPDAYLQALKNFGFGARTEISFPGEIAGRVPPRNKWSPLTTANVGFGQGILVTQLQMLRAYAAFANGGWLVKPTLIKADDSAALPKPTRILPEGIAEQVTQALLSVTAPEGTGVKASLEGYVVAGKTGTAQVVDPITRRYSGHRFISSFIGYPVGIEPKLVILTALDEPKGVYYASDTAAPLFREVLNAAVIRFGIPSRQTGAPALAVNKPKRVKPLPLPFQDQLSWSAASSVRALEWQGSTDDGRVIWKMPSFIGMTAREALRELKGQPFHVEIRGHGWIHAQKPEAGAPLTQGMSVSLKLQDEPAAP